MSRNLAFRKVEIKRRILLIKQSLRDKPFWSRPDYAVWQRIKVGRGGCVGSV